jgi:ATP-binding cassette, subfamily B, bacterial
MTVLDETAKFDERARTTAADWRLPLDQLARYEPPKTAPNPDPDLGWIRRLLPVLGAFRWSLGLTIAFFSIGMAIRAVIPRVLMAGIDNGVDGDDSLVPYAIALGALALVAGVAGYVSRREMFRMAYRVETSLRHTVFAHLLRLSPSFYDTSETGQLVSRANGDIRAVQMFLAFGPVMMLNLVMFAVSLFFMLQISATLTVVAMAPMPLVVLIANRSRQALLPVSWVVMARQAEVGGLVEENVSGVRVIRSFAAEDAEIAKMNKVADQLRWAQVRHFDVTAQFAPLLENLPRLGLAAVLLYGGLLAEGGEVTPGALAAFSAYVVMLQMPFRFIGQILQMNQRARAAALRVYEILDEPVEIDDAPGAQPLTDVEGLVEFRNVRFGYGANGDVLRDFELTLHPGESVALVGETAAGKSTVARLLTRMYDVREGEVCIDGNNVRDVTLESLRDQVRIALDEPFLFSTTIRDNIAYGDPSASLEQIREAADAAQALEFIEELDHGFETAVGERGYTLSGGQRQRIALARALLGAPPILVLDDATSAIDVRIEALIHEALTRTTADRTVLIIAHRLSTISLADRVALLDDGHIVAEGTHEQLLASEPRYVRLLEHLEEAEAEATAADDPQRGPS